MLIQVEHHSGVPVYRQIIEQISFHIASGLVQVGDELPSVRHLSKELHINPMTISKAFSFLEHDGLVERRPGRPLVVAQQPEPQEYTQKLALVTEEIRAITLKSIQLGLTFEQMQTEFKRLWDEVDS